MKREPKFKQGQLVILKDHGGFIYKIDSWKWNGHLKEFVYYELAPHGHGPLRESELRPLNREEKGD